MGILQKVLQGRHTCGDEIKCLQSEQQAHSKVLNINDICNLIWHKHNFFIF